MASTASYDKKRAHFTYLWKIESAPRCVFLKSPVFTVPSMEMTKWNLIMDIKLPENASSTVDVISMLIERNEEDDGPESIEVDFEMAFLDASGSSLIKKSGSGQFRKKTKSGEFEFSTNALCDKREGWLFSKDPLTIRCRLRRKGLIASNYELCFANTRYNSYRASFVWALKRFSPLRLGEWRTRFIDFGEKGCPQITLSCVLGLEDYELWVLLFLQIPNLNNFFISVRFTLLNHEGEVSYSNQEALTHIYSGKCIKVKLFEKCEEAAFLSDDVLFLQCELGLFSTVAAWSRIDDYKLMDHPNSRMDQKEKSGASSDDTTACPFKSIVNSFKEEGTLSDVSLRAGTKSFPVHKLILSSRSPVFRAMFTEDMREKTSKCIDIPDMDGDTLGRLLSYIYEDTVQELTWETADNLYEAADEYALLDLKEKCSSVLKSNISESNVCKILVIADLHQDESLKKSVQQFMQDNPEIMKSDVWKAFRKEHSELAFETTEQIIFDLKCSRS